MSDGGVLYEVKLLGILSFASLTVEEKSMI